MSERSSIHAHGTRTTRNHPTHVAPGTRSARDLERRCSIKRPHRHERARSPSIRVHAAVDARAGSSTGQALAGRRAHSHAAPHSPPRVAVGSVARLRAASARCDAARARCVVHHHTMAACRLQRGAEATNVGATVGVCIAAAEAINQNQLRSGSSCDLAQRVQRAVHMPTADSLGGCGLPWDAPQARTGFGASGGYTCAVF